MLWEVNNCFEFWGQKTKGGGGTERPPPPPPPPPQPSPHVMVLKERKTMQAPVLVGSVQSLISFVMYRRGFHAGLCSLGCSSFYLLPPCTHPCPVEKWNVLSKSSNVTKFYCQSLSKKNWTPYFSLECHPSLRPTPSRCSWSGGEGGFKTIVSLAVSWVHCVTVSERLRRRLGNGLINEIFHLHWARRRFYMLISGFEKKLCAVTTQKGNYWLKYYCKFHFYACPWFPLYTFLPPLFLIAGRGWLPFFRMVLRSLLNLCF